MRFLPKKILFISLLFLFFLATTFFIPKNIYAQQTTANVTANITTGDKPWTIWEDAMKNCGEGEINMRELEKLDGKTRVSNCRTENARLGAILYNIGDTFIPINPLITDSNKKPRAVTALGDVMAIMIANPPASGITYVADVLQNSGFITKPAYAQGIGFAGLSPLLPLWKMMRNIAYSVLIIVMLIIGFMIIFRMKIDPKTVISVQAAIPRIILTLVLITFSYAIAGFLIDLMYLVIFLLVELTGKAIPLDYITTWQSMGLTDVANNIAQQQNSMAVGGWWDLWKAVFAVGTIPAFFQNFLGSWFNTLVIAPVAGGGLGFLIAWLFKGALWTLVGGLGAVATGAIFGPFILPLILVAIIGFGLFYTLIRLTFLLLNAYIQLLIAIILGPLLLLKEAIPGQSAFGNWIKTIMANLIVFPATIGVIYLSWMITMIAWSYNLWYPPLIPVGGGGEVGSVGGIGPANKGNPMALFLGLGIIFLAPQLVASVKKLFQVKPAVPVTAGAAFSPLTGTVSGAMGLANQFYYLQALGERGFGKWAKERFGFLGGPGGSKSGEHSS